MDFKNILSNASFFLKSNAPDILFGAGIIGSISGTVLACIETTKIEEKKKIFNKKLEKIHSKKLNDAELKRELTKEFVKFGFEILKLYSPSIIIEILSIASLTGSNKMLKKRSVEAAAAYATLMAAFRKYRKEISEKIGEDEEKKIFYGLKSEEDKKSDKEEIINSVKKINDHSPFAVIFDEYNPNWSKDSFERKYFLKAVQEHMNDILDAKGYLFLNEVYRSLGFPETKAGQVYGWLKKKDDPNYIGDGYVDFGIYDIRKFMNVEFINGYEPGIVLDFNVDGDILQLTNTGKDAKLYVGV